MRSLTVPTWLREPWSAGRLCVVIGAILSIQITVGYVFDNRVITADSLRLIQATLAHGRSGQIRPMLTPTSVKAAHAVFVVVAACIRIVGVALLLQGLLLVAGHPVTLAHSVKATTLGALVLATGEAAHVVTLLRIVGPISAAEMARTPLSLGSLVFDSHQIPTAFANLLNRINPIECAWVITIACAIVWAGERRLTATKAAITCWAVLTLGQWAVLESLSRVAAR
jgi:hypothetical protein